MRTDDLREAVRNLESRVDRRFEHIEIRLDTMNRMMWALLIAVMTGLFATLGGVLATITRP